MRNDPSFLGAHTVCRAARGSSDLLPGGLRRHVQPLNPPPASTSTGPSCRTVFLEGFLNSTSRRSAGLRDREAAFAARALRVLSLRCSGRLFAALARHAPIVGARGVSVGSRTWSERSSLFHQKCCESRRRAAREYITCSFSHFRFGIFSSLSVFLLVVEHSQ